MSVDGGEGPTTATPSDAPGNEASAQAADTSEAWLPGWLVRHPLYAGWAWTGFWAALILLDEFLDLAGWSWYLLVGMAALPTLLSTLAVLNATPRKHLKPQNESVLGHFFVRFLALVTAFLVWGVSVVMSASISTTVQAAVGNSEREVTALGFNLLVAAVPLVISVLWMAFIVRCAWFPRRLRGWSQSPASSRVPRKFLRSRPDLRRVVVGLAHPGLLLVAGLGMSILALFLNAVELTFKVLA
ncbi:hypothetical protein [Arthrobacter sp. FW306-2-2C-D06B]|uniref:hypothetical protein n=1 Tax=Arthrobacter sp. FW306-2-2C-D06B TaxID=2879618 RepID=UPI001F2163DF|nr:hypothetical protein [Arthrobacter sp. FW306-2-2C-D06B]UKA60245.1 hypothetical protein LFT47_07890 [Arthrobacter sp. FW306-2-2C-D06B]